jgi:hypothetical protein
MLTVTMCKFSDNLYININIITKILIHLHTIYIILSIYKPVSIKSLTINSNMQNIVSHEQLKITVMLVSVIIVFFVCQAPYVIYTAYVNLNQYFFVNNHETFDILRCAKRDERSNKLETKTARVHILYSLQSMNTLFCMLYSDQVQ